MSMSAAHVGARVRSWRVYFTLSAIIFRLELADATATMSPACAEVNEHESNGWRDAATGRDLFNVKIHVRSWQPGGQVRLRWASAVTIDQHYGVALSGTDSSSMEVTVVMGESQGTANSMILPSFVLQGHGTSSMPTSIICMHSEEQNTTTTQSDSDVVSDCPLGIRWTVSNPYPQLSDAKVYVEQWEVGRTITLEFRGEELSVTNPHHAVWSGTILNGQDTIAHFDLDRLAPEFICHSGHVSADGSFVRDSVCPQQYQNGGPFFSFQMQPGSTNAPLITCNAPSPPMPAQPGQDVNDPLTTALSVDNFPSSSPPPPPHPPPEPSPPPMAYAAGCLAGGSAVVEHTDVDNDVQVWTVAVQPDYMWPTGYAYVVGMQGLRLSILDTVGAELEMHGSSSQGYDNVQELVFVPSPVRPRFTFSVSGVDLQIAWLGCRQQNPSPPPPGIPPPLPSLPPPTTSESGALGRSFASRTASCVILLVVAIAYCARYEKARWFRSMHKRLSAYPNSATEGASVLPRASDPSIAGRTGRVRPQHDLCQIGGGTSALSDDDDEFWSVIIRVDGREIEAPPLPVRCASNVSQLQDAIASIASELLGPHAAPSEWLAGDLDSMQLQYLTIQARLATVRPSTDFNAILESRVLRVSYNGGRRAS